jgi:hypothetical protein
MLLQLEDFLDRNSLQQFIEYLEHLHNHTNIEPGLANKLHLLLAIFEDQVGFLLPMEKTGTAVFGNAPLPPASPDSPHTHFTPSVAQARNALQHVEDPESSRDTVLILSSGPSDETVTPLDLSKNTPFIPIPPSFHPDTQPLSKTPKTKKGKAGAQ